MVQKSSGSVSQLTSSATWKRDQFNRVFKHLISRILLQNDVSHNSFVVPRGNYKM